MTFDPQIAQTKLRCVVIAVTPAHVYMLQRPELFGVPYWALIMRLPIQAALLALIMWSTLPTTHNPQPASP